MKFRPLHDRVVIRRVEEETKSKGGIIIPDTAKEKPMRGEVVAIGPGGRDEAGKLIPIDLKVGEIILFGKWSGTEVKIDDKEYGVWKFKVEGGKLNYTGRTVRGKADPMTFVEGGKDAWWYGKVK